MGDSIGSTAYVLLDPAAYSARLMNGTGISSRESVRSTIFNAGVK